ncbi:MAG: isoprenylcysteine carboxylmethyltransferase family protein [Firmicutes bacterium]|nr:isoprenylcysteine carboxylmethyltransferase family protein [Bacillota bacterium]
MTSNRFRTEPLPAIMTVLAGVATLAASILFADCIPVSKHAARLAGLLVLYLGMALFAWAAFHLKDGIHGLVEPRSGRGVVNTGPYSVIRHPIYVAMLIALIGAAIASRSIVGIASTLLVFLPAEIHRARLEERALADAFPEPWREYASRTGFFLPRLRRRVGLPQR